MTWYHDTLSNWTGNHNFYIYQEENPGGKIWLIPWDLPATLTKTDPIIDDFGVPEWNVAPETCAPMEIWSGSLAIAPHCDKLTGLLADALWDSFVPIGEQLDKTCFDSDHMKARIDRYAALVEPAIAQDPVIDLAKWKNEIRDLRVTMDILNKGFDDYIHGRTLPVDTSGFLTPFPDSGFLRTDRVNNFEFSSGVSLPSWTSTSILAGSGSMISLALDTQASLWGKSDLLCSFVFLPLDSPSAYCSERADIGIHFQKTTDLSGLKRLRLDLKCDVPRHCFVYLQSKTYEQQGIKSACGWQITATAASKQYTFDISQIGYPSSVAGNTSAILDSVLISAEGIGLSPSARFDNLGKLVAPADSGYMQVDNIIFEY